MSQIRELKLVISIKTKRKKKQNQVLLRKQKYYLIPLVFGRIDTCKHTSIG